MTHPPRLLPCCAAVLFGASLSGCSSTDAAPADPPAAGAAGGQAGAAGAGPQGGGGTSAGGIGGAAGATGGTSGKSGSSAASGASGKSGATSGGGGAGASGQGGGGGSAGAKGGGAGASGGAAGGAGSKGATCTALLCDDFESGVIDPAKWKVDVGYDPANALTLEGDKVAHGAKAAHAHLAETGGGFASLRETATFPALGDELWGRAYFYTTVQDGAGHTGFVSGYVNGGRVLEAGQSNGNWQLTYYEPGKEYPVGYNTKIPQNKWVCLEWHFAHAGPKLIEIYTDGALAVSYDASGHTFAPLTELGIGIDNHSKNPPGNDVYLDDVAVDAKRVGCLP